MPSLLSSTSHQVVAGSLSITPIMKSYALWDNKKLSDTTKPLKSWLQRISTKQDFTLRLKTHGNIMSMFFFPYIYKIRRNRNVCGRTLLYLVHSTGVPKKNSNTPGICVLLSGILSSIPLLCPKLIMDTTGKRMELQVTICKSFMFSKWHFKKLQHMKKSLRNETQLPCAVWNINYIEMEEHFCSCCLEYAIV